MLADDLKAYDFYQECIHCGYLVNTYNEHVYVHTTEGRKYLHVNCAHKTNIPREHITFVNLWCGGSNA